MSHSARQPTSAGFRTQPGAKSARHIAREVWETLRSEVKQKYIDEALPLEAVMLYMESSHGFSATLSQWKKQLNRWDMRRNLNARDAAHALRLYLEAEAAGVSRIVFCSDVKKTRDSINSYISKSELFDAGVALLQSIAGDPTPSHITYRDTTYLPQTPQRASMQFLAARITPGAAGSPWTPTGSGQPSPDKPLLTTPTSTLSKSSSFTSLLIDDLNIEGGRACQQPHEYTTHHAHHNGMIEDPIHAEEDWRVSEDDLRQILAANVDNGVEMWEQLLARGQNAYSTEPNGMLYSMLSATPIAVMPCQTHSNHDVISGSRSKNMRIPTDKANDVEVTQLQPQNGYGDFLSHCFSSCIWRGQGFNQLADDMLAKAMTAFENMVIHDSDETLTALNVLVTMLEAHGQLNAPILILDKAQSIAEQRHNLPLIVTIRFMSSIVHRAPPEVIAGNVEILRDTHSQFVRKFGPRSKSALTANYNLAWAFASQQTEDGFRQASQILTPLKEQCELKFGRWHFTTTCTSATLARMHFRLGRAEDAESMIADLIAGLDEGLPRFHPYKLEARGRQALFLEKLGKIDEARVILYEITQDRFAILGPQNPRSRSSFEDLQRILRLQGRGYEIDGLYQHFLNAVNREYEANRWKAY